MTLIERALESLTDPSHAKEIARLAFDAASDDFDRHDPEQLALFIHGPLADAVEDVLGAAAIDTVCSYVEAASRSLPAADPEQSGVMNRPGEDALRLQNDTLRTGPRPLVLLVSSNEELRDQLDPWLSEAGYAMVWCPEPDTVVAQCTAIHPQVAILDEDMPGLQRRKVVGLVQHALRADAPPLISVGRLAPESTTGLEAFLRRPLDRSAFIAEINQIAAPPDGYSPPPASPAPPGDDEGARLMFLLDEAMRRLVAGPVRDAILRDALERVDLEAIPTDVAAFTEFVVGPLARAVGDALGDDLSEALLADLEPIVMQARESSGLQRRPGSDPTLRRPESPTGEAAPRRVLALVDTPSVRRVLVATIRERGHHVDETDDAHAALERCVERQPHAVLVHLRRSGVLDTQFCALMALTLGERRPAILVVTESGGETVGSRPGADMVSTSRAVGAIADDLDHLLELAAESTHPSD